MKLLVGPRLPSPEQRWGELCFVRSSFRNDATLLTRLHPIFQCSLSPGHSVTNATHDRYWQYQCSSSNNKNRSNKYYMTKHTHILVNSVKSSFCNHAPICAMHYMFAPPLRRFCDFHSAQRHCATTVTLDCNNSINATQGNSLYTAKSCNKQTPATAQCNYHYVTEHTHILITHGRTIW